MVFAFFPQYANTKYFMHFLANDLFGDADDISDEEKEKDKDKEDGEAESGEKREVSLFVLLKKIGCTSLLNC